MSVNQAQYSLFQVKKAFVSFSDLFAAFFSLGVIIAFFLLSLLLFFSLLMMLAPANYWNDLQINVYSR